MKARVMIEKLQTADPEADVQLLLDEVFVYPEQADELSELDAASYGVPFDFDLCVGGTNADQINHSAQLNVVSLKVSKDAVERHFEQRKLDCDLKRMVRKEELEQAIRNSHPAVAQHDESAAVAVMISRSTLDNLFDLVESCNEIHREHDGYTSHGELTLSKLLSMLVEDAGRVISRPGSLVGEAMSEVLRCHGYA